MYLIIDSSNEAAVVDPYDASKISNAIKEQGVNVTSLITTHHHADHSGGNSKFVSIMIGHLLGSWKGARVGECGVMSINI